MLMGSERALDSASACCNFEKSKTSLFFKYLLSVGDLCVCDSCNSRRDQPDTLASS